MKVLQLCSVFETVGDAARRRHGRFDPLGGMQTHTAALSRALDRAGVEQVVLTTRPPGTPPCVPLGTAGQVVRVGVPVPVARQLYGLAAGRRVRHLVADVDLVHAHQGEDLAVLPLAASVAGRLGVPLVVTLHTSVRHTMRVHNLRSFAVRAIGAGVEADVLRQADAVLTLTGRAARHVLADGVPPERVHVLPSGFEPALFAAAAADPEVSALPGRRILFVGRLHPQKDLPTLLRAVPLLGTPGARLVVVGDGPDRPQAERLARQLGLGRAVTFLGAVPHHRIPAILAAGEVLAMPSRYEELGSVLVEALRAGLPAVASRVGGIPDVVRDGVTGLLVPPGDPAALAAGLDRVLGQPTLAARLSAAGRERATAYDWSHLAGRVRDVYARLVEARTSPAYDPAR